MKKYKIKVIYSYEPAFFILGTVMSSLIATVNIFAEVNKLSSNGLSIVILFINGVCLLAGIKRESYIER